MRSALPLALFATTGCDLVFGLGGRVEPVVDAPIVVDAPPGVDSLPPCQRNTSTVVAAADTTLIPDPNTCDPSIRFGLYRNANLGQQSGGARSRILVRFALLPDMIQGLQGDGFESATLTIPLKPEECSGSACASAPITFAIYAVNNDWHEGQTTGNIGTGWCMREQLGGPGSGVRWTADGANGAGTDRSASPLATIAMTAAQAGANSFDVPIASSPAFADLVNWVDGTQLSILLVPTGMPGTVFTKTKDNPSNGGMQLQVTTCR